LLELYRSHCAALVVPMMGICAHHKEHRCWHQSKIDAYGLCLACGARHLCLWKTLLQIYRSYCAVLAVPMMGICAHQKEHGC
jgi:hypothetical protein